MKRLPLVASFLLFIVLCASLAYWGMELFKPAPRQVAAPPRVAQAEVRTEAASGLFGGRRAEAAVASNYQLRGVIFSGRSRDSVAIISADGQPPQAVRVDMEVMPGVTVKEVHRGYVLLSENGATKRVELPEEAEDQGSLTYAPATPPPGQVPGRAIPSRAQAAAAASPTPLSPPPPPAMPPPASTFVPGQVQAPIPGQVPPVAPQTQNQMAGQVPGQYPYPGQVPGQSTTGVPPTVVVSPPPSGQTGGAPATASSGTAMYSSGASTNPSNVPQQPYTPAPNTVVPANPQLTPGLPPAR
jgi:general secretion pathway protein C